MSKEKIKDYSEYAFRGNVDLTIKAGELDYLYKQMDAIIKESISDNTGFRYNYVHNTTSEIAPAKTSKAKLEKDYTKVFDPEKTISADPDMSITEVGKRGLAVNLLLGKIRNRNIDEGKGELISKLQEENESAPETTLEKVE